MCIVARRTPCDWSETVSLSGERVDRMRPRRSASSASVTSILNGRIALSLALVGRPARRVRAPVAAMRCRRLGAGRDVVMLASVDRCGLRGVNGLEDGPATRSRLLNEGVADTLVQSTWAPIDFISLVSQRR